LGVETREAIAVFCGIGLIVSLLLATFRLDLSAGVSDTTSPPLITGRM
jgi:hypothetical protein